MKTNEELQKDVLDAIKWEPLLNAAEIGVTAKDGIVSLTGVVSTYGKKLEAERAAQNVEGVKAVVENILVKLPSFGFKDDKQIAQEVLDSLKWNWQVPHDEIKIMVEEGWVNLEGEVKWNYQKDAAKKLVVDLDGVKGVTNNITIKIETPDEIEQKGIEKALFRNWATNNNAIKVGVLGNTIRLYGTAISLYQKDEASRIAWNAPGVLDVENELVIEYES